MSFLLDTDTCSAHLKRPSGLMHRFAQHSGGLHIASITLAELYTWAYRRDEPEKLLKIIDRDLLRDIVVVDFDHASAMLFGQVQSQMLRQGTIVNPVDLMIGATALAHNLTLVTHNTRHFQSIPNLRLADWLDD
jgi:tRNA(fMet)-specific endonuclease VapC